MKTHYLFALGTLCIGAAACGQSTFQNLDFEQAVVQPLPSDNILLEWSLAVPGWSSATSFVYYREGHLGVGPLYLLMDPTSPVWAPGTQLAGQYSLAFTSGYAGNNPSGPWVNVGIAQSGVVPNSSRSIRLLAHGTFAATGPFQVFLGAVEIPMFSLGGNSYGGDISGFAGDFVNLRIVNSAGVGHLGEGVVVDNILFSPEVIPEPSTLGLLGLSGLLLAAQWHYRKGVAPYS